MLSKREVEELILGMAQIVREKRYLEEENRMLKEMIDERDKIINEHLRKSQSEFEMIIKTALTRSMKNIDELLQEDENNADDIFWKINKYYQKEK